MGRTLAAILVVLSLAATNGSIAAPFQRTFSDQPDDITGPQIHVMYVLPSDGTDEDLDINGKITTSVAAFQQWLATQTGGRRLRLDTAQGALDITFYRLTRTDAQMQSYGAQVRDEIEHDLVAAGFDRPDKIYAVYYGGGSTVACGGAPWPPVLVGSVAALYLHGTPPGAPACDTNQFTSAVDKPGYLEFAMIHEIMHAQGIVASCAPHFGNAGHVSDDPRDLMYAGPLPWTPSVLDVGHDDYYAHTNAGCLDLAQSPYLAPVPSVQFGDVPPDNLAAEAITQLTTRGFINGCDPTAHPPLFCPGDTTLREQMAALIVRAIPGWSAETHPPTFTDPTNDAELMQRVGTLQFYGVVGGYTAPTCQALGLGTPCYGPLDPVLRAQAISFITRALVKKGYWQDQPIDPTLYGGVLAGTGHEQDAATYWHYTRARGGVPDYPENGSFPVDEAAPRDWFARLLWTALQGTPAISTP